METERGLKNALRSLDPHLLSGEDPQARARMLREDTEARVRAANRRDAQARAEVETRADWEAFVAPRIEALRRSLGDPPPQADLNAEITGTVDGDGYRIENVLYESRRDVPVTANLYLPSPPRVKMPAILLVHSHHNPKTQGELQDMGMMWARQGCAVLVMDAFGYGERRQHAPGPRQDYRFRYINGIQLHLIGESLMGWMVWDVVRGVDLLLAREDVDPDRVILIGAVAGGGDPAAVAAALDPRIACSVPFNFGGPQPETVYPFPEDAEASFNYMGWGGWESTRNLRLSARDGFLPWSIVASIAPRRLIYAHEFSWDQDRDPVWRRLQAVYGFCGAEAHLGFTHGRGLLSGRPPEASHCNNVGPLHRENIHRLLQSWFGIAPPDEAHRDRRPDSDLTCLTPEVNARRPARPMHELFEEIGVGCAAAIRTERDGLEPDIRREHLRRAWAELLGEIDAPPAFEVCAQDAEMAFRYRVERLVLQVERNIRIPLLLLLPEAGNGSRVPVAVAVSQEGKKRFLADRAEEIAALLAEGIPVCLPDVRGTGETCPDPSRGPQSRATSIASTELMLGQTLLGSRLRDMRAVLRYLRTRRGLGGRRFVLWGDSFAPTNPPSFPDPLLGEGLDPTPSEPLGGLLALFGALYEEDVCAAIARGMLAGYRAALRDRTCYLPYDVVVPGALRAGDLCDVAAALAPRPLLLERLVDGRNCLLPGAEAERTFEPARRAYREAARNLCIKQEGGTDLAAWLKAARER